MGKTLAALILAGGALFGSTQEVKAQKVDFINSKFKAGQVVKELSSSVRFDEDIMYGIRVTEERNPAMYFEMGMMPTTLRVRGQLNQDERMIYSTFGFGVKLNLTDNFSARFGPSVHVLSGSREDMIGAAPMYQPVLDLGLESSHNLFGSELVFDLTKSLSLIRGSWTVLKQKAGQPDGERNNIDFYSPTKISIGVRNEIPGSLNVATSCGIVNFGPLKKRGENLIRFGNSGGSDHYCAVTFSGKESVHPYLEFFYAPTIFSIWNPTNDLDTPDNRFDGFRPRNNRKADYFAIRAGIGFEKGPFVFRTGLGYHHASLSGYGLPVENASSFTLEGEILTRIFNGGGLSLDLKLNGALGGTMKKIGKPMYIPLSAGLEFSLEEQ